MNKIAFLLAIVPLLCIISCKKISNSIASGTRITLAAPKVSGNLITLNWTNLNNSALQNYYVVRVTDTTNTLSDVYITVDKSTVQYVDTLPLVPYVQYFIVGQLSTTTTPVTSNKETYTRTDIPFMAMTPMDAIFDRANQQLFVYSDSGKIAVYDLQSKKWTNHITTNAVIGYCDIGTYNGVEELYVPRSDGWCYIYNAATLAQIDQVNVGNALSAVVNSNGILYFCNTNTNINVTSYSRATKARVSQAPVNSITRMRLIPGTNSLFFCTTAQDENVLFVFDNTGKYVSDLLGYTSSYNPTPSIFEVFPNGSDYISSSYGVIYSSTLAYVSTLPFGSLSYTSFDFDATNQLIYAGCTTKSIQSYSMSDYKAISTVNTQGYPFKIFYNSGSLLSVSTNVAPPSPSGFGTPPVIYTFVEQR